MGSHPQHQMLCGSVCQTTRSGADISAFADPQRAVGLIFVGVQITGKPFYRLLWSRFPTGFGGGVTAMLIRIAEYFSVRKRVHDLEILHRLLAPESTFRLLDVGGGAGQRPNDSRGAAARSPSLSRTGRNSPWAESGD